MKREYSAAKLWLRAAGSIQFVALGIALIPLVHKTPTTEVAAAIAAFVVPVIVIFLRARSGPHHVRGEHIKRLFLIKDGLGHDPPRADIADILAQSTGLPSLDPDPIGSYFSSEEPPGTRRLVQNLQESAFYSKENAALATNLYRGSALIGLAAVGALVYYWLSSYFGAMDRGATDYAQVYSALVTFFVAGYLAETSNAFSELRQEAEHVYRESEALQRGSNIDVNEAYGLLLRYSCATARCVPIPGVVHRFNQKSLDTAWRSIFVARSKGSP